MVIQLTALFLLGILGNLVIATEGLLDKSSSENVSEGTHPSLSEFVYKSYQATIKCKPSTGVLHPQSISEVEELVKTAVRDGKTVKAFGSLHSMTDLICTDGIPLSMKNLNELKINEDGKTVTVGAGAELNHLFIYLHERNKTLIHMPHFGGITVGGSMGTGAHGSSLIHPTSLADQVVRLTIIDGNGDVQIIDNVEELQAFRIHLGLLGVIVDVTLRIVPLFKMTAYNYLQSESILLDGTGVELALKHDFLEFGWFPNSHNVVVITGNYTNDVEMAGDDVLNLYADQTKEGILDYRNMLEKLHETKDREGLVELERRMELSLYEDGNGLPPYYTEEGTNRSISKNPATGFAWKMLSNRCRNNCAWDNEGDENSLLFEDTSIAVDVEELAGVVKTIQKILARIPATFPLIGVFIRFYRESDALMSMTGGRPSAVIEIPSFQRHNPYEDARYGLGAYQAIAQAILKEHNGRAHWGKNGLAYFSRDAIKSSRASKRDSFIKVMSKYDPNGVFMNKFGRRLIGLSDEVEMDEKRVRRCALQEFCICSKNEDCAEGQSCSSIYGYSVCQDISHLFEPLSHQSKTDEL